MTSPRRSSTKRLLVVAAVSAVVYSGCWAATSRFGCPAVATSVSTRNVKVRATSPCPFIVELRDDSRDGSGFAASYLWLGGMKHELSREPSLAPFINTLF